MTRRSRGAKLAALLLAAALGCACSDAVERPKTGSLFGEPAVHALALTIERSAMAALAREPKDWVHASLTIGGESYPAISIRFKGHRSLRGWADKPALKLAFDRGRHEQRRILGLRGLVLNNMADDRSMLREQLGARVYAALGVPASRASFAELTINGQRFGLYSLLESVDEDMLARHFGDGSGPVYEGEYGCDLYPEDVWGFEHDRGADPGRAQLLKLTQQLSKAPDSLLGSDTNLDRDRLLSYLAASTLLADFDGYRHGHNYRIHRDPKSGRWSFIPWGFDRVLKKDFGVFDSQGRVARVCFQDRRCRLAYVKALQAATQRFEQLHLQEFVNQLDRMIMPFLERDPRRSHSRAAHADAVAQLMKFVSAQPASLRRQLNCWDGQSERDADGDGFGCMDCDDHDAAIHPGADERCDGVDNDCSGHSDDSASCACPTEQVDDASYLLCDMPMSFWEAEQFCHSLGSTLAKLESIAAMRALHRRTQAKRKDEWWVGLDDQAREGVYVWPDQSRPVRGLWAAGEPDHYVCGQHCAALRAGKGPGLRDVHCATAAPFVCAAAAVQLSRRPEPSGHPGAQD